MMGAMDAQNMQNNLAVISAYSCILLDIFNLGFFRLM